MPDHKSDQITKLEAGPRKFLPPDELAGRKRVSVFTFAVPAAGVAIAETVALCTVPEGARILGGHAAWEAMSTGAGAATMELGDGTTAAKYLEATDIDAAGSANFADTVARNTLEKLTDELTLTATASVEAWAATKKLVGWIEWTLD